jgi:hypothetical protein
MNAAGVRLLGTSWNSNLGGDMTSLVSDLVEQRSRAGFWRRQFTSDNTWAQRIFDVLFGVVAPVLCFAFDPIVFKASDFGGALFPSFQAYVYMVSGIEILLLLSWMGFGPQLHPSTRLLGGVLAIGGFFSVLIGVIILPFTLMGLFLGIGIFGFIPFLTGLVYLRNGRRAFQLAQTESGAGAWIRTLLLGWVLVLGAPAGVNFVALLFVSQSMNAVLYGNSQSADIAVEQLKYLSFFAGPEIGRLVSAYTAETDPLRREELKRRYLKLTGEDIDVKLRILAD